MAGIRSHHGVDRMPYIDWCLTCCDTMIFFLPDRGNFRLGVSRIILHTDMLPSAELPKWQAAKLAEAGLEKIADFGSDVVFQIYTLKSKKKL